MTCFKNLKSVKTPSIGCLLQEKSAQRLAMGREITSHDMYLLNILDTLSSAGKSKDV